MADDGNDAPAEDVTGEAGATPTETTQAEMDPAGFPRGVPWREMSPEHQSAYWRHQSKRHEADKRAALGERDALRADAEAFRALDQASKTDADRRIADLERQLEAERSSRAEDRRLAGEQVVHARLDAVANSKGMTAEQLRTLAGDVSRFFGDAGVDRDAVDEFLAALPDAAKSPAVVMTPSSLGGGRRAEARTSGVSAGLALYESERKKSPSA